MAADGQEPDVKARLFEAASHLLAEVGPSDLSLREVARRAGVSHAAPYNHFANKQALLVALSVEGWRGLDRSMADAQAMAASAPLDQYLATGLGYLRYALRHPATYKLMLQAEFQPADDDPVLLDCSIAPYQRLADAVRTVRAERGLSVDEDAVGADCLVSWGVVHGLAGLAIDAQVPGLSRDDMGIYRALLERLGAIYGPSPAR